MVKITKTKIKKGGDGNGIGLTDNKVTTQENNMKMEMEQPPTALAKNAVKCP